MAVAVVDKTGIPLMPTTEAKARILLKKGRAVIFKHRPTFTIRITDREGGNTQPVEYKCDTGYEHIGVSICSEKHEYVNAQYDLLTDEKSRHDDCRKYRRDRRNRLRYRKPRFNNRKGLISKDGFAPSIRNKRDVHIRLFQDFAEVIPVTSAVFEMGQFDIRVLKALEEGKPLPEGTDYQQGERYGTLTLREAVFARDHYTCQVCKKNAFKDKMVLCIHHAGFWYGDHTDRLSGLMTVCTGCHTSKNHKKGGNLWGIMPKTKPFTGASFMNQVKWSMYNILKATFPDTALYITYGAETKLKRQDLKLKKSHSNDAYVMGNFHPGHRTDFLHFKKRRRNNRILERFYDAKYIDIRDGKKKSGSQLSCNRTNRREPRLSEKNERIYHGQKISCGRRSIRRQRYLLQPGDTVLLEDKIHTVKGTHCNGSRVMLASGRSVSVKKIHLQAHAGGWTRTI